MNEMQNMVRCFVPAGSYALIENRLYAICTPPTTDSVEKGNSANTGTNFNAEPMTTGSFSDQNGDDISRNSISLTNNGRSFLTVNQWIGCDMKNFGNNKIVEKNSNSENNESSSTVVSDNFLTVSQILGMSNDSSSNAILRGNDVCLPTYETISQTNSVEKLSTNNESSSHTVGFFDSNQNRPTIVDIFSMNANKESVVCFEDGNRTKKSHECGICGRDFNRQISLIVHSRTHNCQKPYQCLICGRTFSQTSNVKRHVETHKVYPHVAPNSTGAHGYSKAEDNFKLTIDLMDNDERTVEPCSFVSKILSPGTSVPCRSTLAFACPYCEKIFDCSKCSQRHLSSHRDRKVFQCILRSCRILIESLGEYLKHVKIHEGEILYSCTLCGKEFRSLNEIGVHQSTHAFKEETKKIVSSRTYCCFVCGSIFKNLENFERHRSNTFHNYACKRCPRVYANGRQLRRHIKSSHSNRDKIRCDVCKKVFSHQYTFKVHMKRHNNVSDQKQFVCSSCEKSFNRQDILRRHVKTVHLAATPFSCSYEGCTKTFKRVDRLKEHVLTHNLSNRKHQCSTCGKTFLRQRAHNMHVSSVHLKTYRFRCDKCNKGFNRPDVLRKHSMKCKMDGKE